MITNKGKEMLEKGVQKRILIKTTLPVVFTKEEDFDTLTVTLYPFEMREELGKEGLKTAIHPWVLEAGTTFQILVNGEPNTKAIDDAIERLQEIRKSIRKEQD